MPKPIPDQPASCAECIYHRWINGVLRCLRHAPGTSREEHDIAYWPVKLPTDVCFLGSIGNNPKAKLVECETCLAWHHTEGGIKPRFPGGMDDVWWAGCGLCRLRAPMPRSEDDPEPQRHLVTHFQAACGDGIDINQPDTNEA